jgi:hypothetical protein
VLDGRHEVRRGGLLPVSPLLLFAVKALASCDGLFWLCVECRECQHCREITAEFLARRFGREARVEVVVKHLRCHKWRAQNPSVLVGLKR